MQIWNKESEQIFLHSQYKKTNKKLVLSQIISNIYALLEISKRKIHWAWRTSIDILFHFFDIHLSPTNDNPYLILKFEFLILRNKASTQVSTFFFTLPTFNCWYWKIAHWATSREKPPSSSTIRRFALRKIRLQSI